MACMGTLQMQQSRSIPEVGMRVVARLSTESLRLAQGIEDMCPKTNFGLWRHNHMQESCHNSDGLAVAAGLSEVDAMLLKIVLCSHDLGRFVEFRLRFENKSGEPKKLLNHGRYSAMLLTEFAADGVFAGFTTDEVEDVIKAVMWHGERVVDLPVGSRARNLCYLLRDQDKLEIFAHDAFGQYDYSFCYTELVSALRVLSNDEIVRCNERREEIVPFLSNYFIGNMEYCDKVAQGDPLFTKILGACSRQATELDESVQAVLAARSAEAMKCYQSFTDLFLLHAAMIFDLQYPYSFKMIRDQQMMEVKWSFVKRHCTPELYAKLRASVTAHIESHATKEI
jgi:hypothetical protein